MKKILQRLIEHDSLSRQEAKKVLFNISEGVYNPSQIASFLTVFMMRQITVEELTGFMEALQELCVRIDMSEFNAIDVVGTGGDEKNTFNISTLSSLVVAGAGEKVTKHGNYSVSSNCGSSNVMEYMGYKFTNDQDKLKRQLDQANICFFHAPLFHPAMKNVAPSRRELGMKTFFNVLGPLINPSFPKNQLAGVYNLETARLYNYVFQQLDKNYYIIHSLDGYDEVSLTGDFKITGNSIDALFSPEDLGFKTVKQEDLFGGDTVAEAGQIFTTILDGKGTEAQNQAVIANAGLAINCFDQSKPMSESFERAKESLLGGKAKAMLKKLVELA